MTIEYALTRAETRLLGKPPKFSKVPSPDPRLFSGVRSLQLAAERRSFSANHAAGRRDRRRVGSGASSLLAIVDVYPRQDGKAVAHIIARRYPYRDRDAEEAGRLAQGEYSEGYTPVCHCSGCKRERVSHTEPRVCGTRTSRPVPSRARPHETFCYVIAHCAML
jgi:hypothetical protein